MDQTIQNKDQIFAQTSEACSSMINNIRQLRLSVLDLFSTLADNGPDPRRCHHPPQESIFSNKLYHQQTMANIVTSHKLCSASIPPWRVQKQQETQHQIDLLQYVNQMISTMTNLIRNLDQDAMILGQNGTIINPGESIHLGMEGSQDKHNLYVDLCQSYKTLSKLTDYSKDCHRLLLQQSLKRVHKRVEILPPGLNHPQSQASREARVDYAVTTFSPYAQKVSLSKSIIIKVLENCVKNNKCIEACYTQPLGQSMGVIQIGVNRVIKGIIVMRGFMIDNVIAKAYHESFARKKATSNKSPAPYFAEISGIPFVDPDDDIDLWSESKYSVFRKLTHHADAAILHFQYPTYPEIAVSTFLNWFSAHADLFAATCSRCNTRLRKFIPPICRDYGPGFSPHHDHCR